VERAARLQRARPGLTLSTDVIVGFPGETADEFEETLSLVREVGFTSLFGFKFSPRPHTPALRLTDDVPEEEKSLRLARLFEVSEAQGQAHLASLVGTRQEVLLEGEGEAKDGLTLATGRTERNEIVHVEVPRGRACAGELVSALVARANKHSLFARLSEGAAESLPIATAPSRRALPLMA
jgi:tRNA-2-methylthio-N6-dimethylallyladenosine synthase